MTKKKAVEVLRSFIDEIPSHQHPDIWKANVASTLLRIFPISGNDKKDRFVSNVFVVRMSTSLHGGGYSVSERQEAQERLRGFIQEIENHGMERSPESNKIIQLVTNKYFWTVVVFVSGVSFTLGYYFGSSTLEFEKARVKELEQKLESLPEKKASKSQDGKRTAEETSLNTNFYNSNNLVTPSNSNLKEETKIIQAKNVNTGVNNGQIGDTYNGNIEQRQFDKKSLDFFAPMIPSKDIRIEVKETATDFETLMFAKDIVSKLRGAGYTNVFHMGLAVASDEMRPCGLGYGLDEKAFWFVVDPCDNTAHK